MIKLYHYVHCPFCLRVRFTLGFLGIEFESIVLPYHDEKTPLALTGVKMLPIVDFGDGVIKNESLDIIKILDQKNLLKSELAADQKLGELLEKIGSDVHSLCMPYWIWTPEFNEESRSYFQKKKEAKRGPFKELMKNKKVFLSNLNETLKTCEERLSPFYESSEFSIKDIILASHLWGMYIFPEFQFSPKMHSYLQDIKERSHFEYHRDFWS